MASPILWQNEGKTVILIDVPGSIAAAQGTVQHPCNDCLLSAEPLKAPFASNEPKSDAAKAKLVANTVNQASHVEYASVLSKALHEVSTHHAGDWCLPRPFAQEPSRKRRRDDDDEDPASKVTLSDCNGAPYKAIAQTEVLTHNDQSAQIVRTLQPKEDSHTCTYRIPSKSSFSLGDCRDSQQFRASIRRQAGDYGTAHHFDFILLDPPWPNRSVRRTHKTAGSTYGIMADLNDTSDLLYGMDLDMLMSADCLVGIWITNKPAVRELVLGEGGLFDTWGVELVEEWIWLKVTCHGEPVTPLSALWRKPYEVLLLGRRQQNYLAGNAESITEGLIRRTVIGVPDLHSRKPCLKALIEPFMRDQSRYRALEVFARHLVAGWWSWGNECLKFNSEDNWRRSKAREI